MDSALGEAVSRVLSIWQKNPKTTEEMNACADEYGMAMAELNKIYDENPPSPRVVWACPEKFTEKLNEAKNKAISEGIPDLACLLKELLSLCCSTREATVEEILRALRGRFSNRDMILTPTEIIEHLNREGIQLVKEGRP